MALSAAVHELARRWEKLIIEVTDDQVMEQIGRAVDYFILAGRGSCRNRGNDPRGTLEHRYGRYN